MDTKRLAKYEARARIIKALAHVSAIEAFDEIITDTSVAPDVLNELHKLSVEITVV